VRKRARHFVGRVLVHLFGRPKDRALSAIVNDFEKRIRGRGISVQAHSERKGIDAYQEGLSKLTGSLVIMDERGEQMSSEELARWLGSANMENVQTNIAIGPSEGFSEEFKAGASHSISLSNLTLTHEMAAAVLLEQLYRATEINRGSPYHRN